MSICNQSKPFRFYRNVGRLEGIKKSVPLMLLLSVMNKCARSFVNSLNMIGIQQQEQMTELAVRSTETFKTQKEKRVPRRNSHVLLTKRWWSYRLLWFTGSHMRDSLYR